MAADSKTFLQEGPLGFLDGRVDEKGRGKFPADVRRYLVGPVAAGDPDPEIFVTSVDGGTVRLYRISDWLERKKALESATELSAQAKRMLFMAADYGEVSAVDSSNRYMIPTNLRRDLEMEGSQVWYECAKGFVTVYNKKVYEARRAEARANAPADLEALERSGLL